MRIRSQNFFRRVFDRVFARCFDVICQKHISNSSDLFSLHRRFVVNNDVFVRGVMTLKCTDV